MPFAIGLGQTTDSVDTAGVLFRAFGAELVDKDGNITVKSDKVRAVLEHGQKLVKVLPDDAVSYDDASNNRALISGKSALIWNPPSAWAVAKRDAPQVAEDCWSFSAPSGPEGRFLPYLPYFWGVWSFSKNKTAAKELIEALLQREPVEQRCDRGHRLRCAAVQLDARLQDLGRGRSAEGHGLQLPDAAVPQRQAAYRGVAGAAGNRGADLQPWHDADDAGEAEKRPVDRSGRRLG